MTGRNITISRENVLIKLCNTLPVPQREELFASNVNTSHMLGRTMGLQI